jgi:hypothetical protein
MSPYYKAVISAKWDEPRRKAALEELESHGAGDLAKRVVSIPFPRSDEEKCKQLCDLLDQHGIAYSVGFDIPWQTLTSWLRETVEAGTMPDLEKIGGQVGQVVKLKSVENE